MAHTLRLLTLALVSGVLAAPAFAQTESLLDIYNRALTQDPAVREAKALYDATSQVKPLTRAGLFPQVSLSGNMNDTFNETVGGALDPLGQPLGTRTQSDREGHGWNLQLQQSVFNWSLYAQLRQADKRVARAETDFLAAQQDLLVRVSNRYFGVLAAEDNLASAIAAREAVARQLEQANRRFEVGLIAITDVQQSQAGYDDAVAVVIDSQRQLATAQEFLREIIGELVTDLAGPIDELPLLSPDPADAEQWVNRALMENLALVSSRMATEVAMDQISIERGNRLPELNFTAGYNDSFSENVQTTFGPLGSVTQPSTQEPEGRNYQLSLTFPIFTGGANRARIQQSIHQHTQAEETLKRISRQTERQTRDAYLGVISEISRVQALRQSVESNRTALRATEAGFEVGTQTTVDVLQAQRSLRTAETSYYGSRYRYMLNILALKQAAGSLAPADLEQLDSWLQ